MAKAMPLPIQDLSVKSTLDLQKAPFASNQASSFWPPNLIKLGLYTLSLRRTVTSG